MTKEEAVGLSWACKSLKNFEERISPEIDGKTALRIAREALEETAAIFTAMEL